ncbi:MAG TPA: fumarate hydratase [bacterium]|nr:fumarate hydratase [bacterium]HOL48877.1 fumarate hydratase [bacterium]HPQ18134.1 fumarate hydratase [bacterium]
MKIIEEKEIAGLIKELYKRASIKLPVRIKNKLLKTSRKEKNKLAKIVYKELIENYKISEREKIPLCQDTGYPEFFITIGRNIQIKGDINKAVTEGTKQATIEGYLRASVIRNVFNRRTNTKYNIPPNIHYFFDNSDKLKIICFPKGGGCDNISKLLMLNPSVSKDEIIEEIYKAIINDIPQACPPIFIGICIGGTSTTAMLYAKLALLKGDNLKEVEAIKRKLKEKINKSGIGAMAYGGKNTVLEINIVLKPVHIASLPVGISVSCNSFRYSKGVI